MTNEQAHIHIHIGWSIARNCLMSARNKSTQTLLISSCQGKRLNNVRVSLITTFVCSENAHRFELVLVEHTFVRAYYF